MELTLTPQDAQTVLVTCDGQPSHDFSLASLKISQKELEKDPIGYGKRLYEALFALDTLAGRTLEADPERILLVPTSPEIDEIAWEYCYGPSDFVVQECPFVRGLPIEQRVAAPTLTIGLHIVAIPSNPLSEELAPLNIEGEWTRLREVVDELSTRVTLERTIPPTLPQLRKAVANQQQRVLHFMGHGGQSKQGAVLCFEQEHGELDMVDAKDLARRIRGTTFLITLNACLSAAPGDTAFSNLAAALVRQKIPYALGMRQPIADQDALRFSRAFYTDLAHGSPVEVALWQARQDLMKGGSDSGVVGIPILYTSLATPADGFVSQEGSPLIIEKQPSKEVTAIPRAEGIFQGRVADLKRMGTLLTGDNRPRVLTIHGGGGQGKTALAREVVERFAHAWPGGVWVATLENLPEKAFIVADLARFLGINTQEIGEAEEMERQIFARLTGKRTLIVLDNAETLVDAIEAQNPQTFALVAFLQRLPSISVSLLVTSRILLGWPGEVTHELEGLSEQEGYRLFKQNAPQRQAAINRTQAQQLSKQVEGHPLSLRLLAGAFNASAMAFSPFVQQCYEQLRQAENKYVVQDHRHRSLYACLDISIRYLSDDLRNLLSALWIFHAPFLDETAVAIFDPEVEETESSPSAIRDQLHLLWMRGLLTHSTITTRDGTLQFYYVLPTTRPYLELQLPQRYVRQELLQRFGEAYDERVRFLYIELNRSASGFALVQQIEADLEQAWQYLEGDKQASYKIQWGLILYRLGLPQRALKLLEDALRIVQGRNLSLTLLALNNMGGVYAGIGQPERALTLYELALPLIREVGDRAGEAATLSNMGGVYAGIGRPERALTLYELALPLRREVGDRAGEAATLSNMGLVYHGIGQPERALTLYELALPLIREVGDRSGEAATLNNMGLVYDGIGQPEQALTLYELALPLMREVGDRAGEAATLSNMGLVYDGIGQPERALTLYELALPLRREVGDRAGEANTLSNMAILLYTAFQRSEAAIASLEQALEILVQTGLPQDAAGQTLEELQIILNRMR